MDNLQTQTGGGQSTGNPQDFGQPLPSSSQLQGTPDNQADLLRLPVNGNLRVSTCTANCLAPTKRIVSSNNSRSETAATSVLLLSVLIVLIWRLASVLKKIITDSQKNSKKSKI